MGSYEATEPTIDACARLMARMMDMCVPQRHLSPVNAPRICSSVAFGLSFNRAAAVMSQPLTQ